MKRLTILVIPENASQTKQIKIPRVALRAIALSTMVLTMVLGYLVFDYVELRSIRNSYKTILAENQGLKGEARLLMSNLDEVKKALNRVQDYSEKLEDLTQLKVKSSLVKRELAR